jgi:hypothetical protein
MYGRPGAQSRDEQDRLMHSHDARQAEWFHAFLGKLFAGVSESVSSEAEPFAGRAGA